MPSEHGFGETRDKAGVFRSEVGGFASVGGEIVKLRIATVVVAKEFPIAVADGEVRVGEMRPIGEQHEVAAQREAAAEADGRQRVALWSAPGIGVEPDRKLLEKFCIARANIRK